MKTISLRTLVREPLKVKRITRAGKAVQVTDNGRPLWILQPANGTAADEAERRRGIDEILDEVLHHTMPSFSPVAMRKECDASLALLQKYISRRAFIEISQDMDGAIDRARTLSEKHTERLGCRGFDLLHVALALDLECETFLTSDHTQAALARAEGLDVTLTADGDGGRKTED